MRSESRGGEVIFCEMGNLDPTGRIFLKSDIFLFFKIKTLQKIQVSLKSNKNNGTLHGDNTRF